jgi:SpoVK/Ycf46/Vps4 family AAA+-type ATPase
MATGTDNYKFREIKTYSSTEWLANNSKKYRSVFDEQEVSYIYCEVSLFNKRFDDKNWKLKMQIKCFDADNNEICDLNCDRMVEKKDPIVFVREGWGVKTPGTYWRAGQYRWEAWVDGELLEKKSFYIENQGLVRNGVNPYFKIETVKLYEGPDANIKEDDRKYYVSFSAMNTRYIWVELNVQNVTRKSTDLALEFIFNFRTANGFLKGSVGKLIFVKPEEDKYPVTVGWGSDIVGTWARGEYYAEIIFMDELIASMMFEVGDDYVEAGEEDFQPMLQMEFLGDPFEETPEEKEADNKPVPVAAVQTLDDVMSELDSLIGLNPIKTKIREYSNYLRFVSLRKEKGFKEEERINLHAVFRGNPGTGKTTVARLLGKIYKELGLLKKGHVHEVDRGDLVAEFIGQTAPKTKEAIKKAKDGILFIDEAYALARKDEDSKDFGREAIEVLLKELSDAGDIAIIVAGYPEEMDVFLESNPGLKSRFNMFYDFPDYVPQELIQIADFSCDKRGVKFSEEAKDILYKYFVDRYRDRDRFFGNARMVNSMIDEAKMNLGLRIMKTEKPEELTVDQLSLIMPEDMEKIFKVHKGMLPDIPIDEELLKESLSKLKKMIGLERVKSDIDELVKLVRFYKDQGKDVRKAFSLHSVFSGNPGTGKTTVARILAQIYKALGILERGHLVECDRQSLVGGYIGQTAIKTSEMLDKAMGGVLFVDEAYSLTEGGSGDYGREAIETLLKRMEDKRGEFIVIAAGYTHNMDRFMESNPGLKSRFDRMFMFEDFKPDELCQIAVNQLAENGITPDPEAAAHLEAYITYIYTHRDKYFGNGRAVRKVIEEAVRNQHIRLSELPKNKRTPKVIGALTMADIAEFKTDGKPTTPTTGIGFKTRQ